MLCSLYPNDTNAPLRAKEILKQLKLVAVVGGVETVEKPLPAGETAEIECGENVGGPVEWRAALWADD